jgi:Uma2 family endonuclease
MSVARIPRISFEDWLAAERAATDARSEFIDGDVFAMTGGTAEHNTIAVNISAELRNQLKRRPCYVYAGDMKVRIEAANAGAYPDVMVVCGERAFHDQRRDILTNPTLIIEILSDSTEAYDRGDKFARYRALPSLQTYLLIAQTRVGAELYVRRPDGRWLLSAFDDLSDTVPLAAIDATLALAEVYDKVDFPVSGADG